MTRSTSSSPAAQAIASSQFLAPDDMVNVVSKARAAGEERNALVVQTFRELRRKRLRMSFLNSSAYHPTFQAFFGAEELGGRAVAVNAARGRDGVGTDRMRHPAATLGRDDRRHARTADADTVPPSAFRHCARCGPRHRGAAPW